MALTDKWLKAHLNKPQAKRFEKAHRDGLSVRVTKNGTISFQYRYYIKLTKKRDFLTIGNYPQYSLAEAVKEMEKYKAILAEGKNPRLEQKSAVIFEAKKITLTELWRNWYENVCVYKKKNAPLYNRTFEIHLKPTLGDLIADNITKPVLLDLLNPLSKAKPSITERIIINLKQAYNWGVDQHLIENNPVKDIFATKLGIEKGQDTRFLSEQEIIWLFEALEKMRSLEKNKVFIELQLFYGCRPQELRETEISEVNFDFSLWTIPWQKHKTGKKTKLPLVRPIIKEVEHLWKLAIALSSSKKWVFNNAGTSDPITRNSISSCIRNINTYWQKHIKDKQGEPIKFDHWTVYSLRKTSRTKFSNWGDWVVCEKMVGHKMGGEADKYDYNLYAKQMVPVYTEWWNYLTRLKNGETNIINFTNRLPLQMK